jgi:hypothetical protein
MTMKRRDLFRHLAAGSAASALSGAESAASTSTRRDNPVVQENLRSGTRNWMLTNPKVTAPDLPWQHYGGRSETIEAYASESSVLAGASIALHVSTNPPAPFKVEVFRCGYYAGQGGRKVHAMGPFEGKPQAMPVEGPNRVMDCNWQPTLQIQTGADWLSGVYVAKLTELQTNTDSYAIFVVRDEKPCDLLIKVNDMNWQSYNRWPNSHSLYCDGKSDANWRTGLDGSLNRPYMKHHAYSDSPLSVGSGEWFCYEFPLAYWMEQQGYHVSYVSCWDVHYRPETLDRSKCLISVGHDEYWTQPMYDAVKKRVRDNGLSALFLCGNSVFGRLDLKPDGSGRPDRVITREGRFKTEHELMGVRSPMPVIGSADWTCTVPEHWIYSGTGMKFGEGLPAMVAWEFHAEAADLPSLEIVAAGETDGRNRPVRDGASGRNSSWFQASIYTGPKNNIVFSASTLLWAYGLGEPPGLVRTQYYDEAWDKVTRKVVQRRMGPDPRVQRITRNLIERAISGREPERKKVSAIRSLPVKVRKPSRIRFVVRTPEGTIEKEGTQDVRAGTQNIAIDFSVPGRHVVSIFVGDKEHSRRIVEIGART